MKINMEEDDETTSLLQRHDTESRRKRYQNSVRRSSSNAGLYPHDIDQYKDDVPESASSSALAIWVVVPISLLGELTT